MTASVASPTVFLTPSVALLAAPVLTLIKGEKGMVVESFITFTNESGEETLRMHHFSEG